MAERELFWQQLFLRATRCALFVTMRAEERVREINEDSILGEVPRVAQAEAEPEAVGTLTQKLASSHLSGGLSAT